MFYLLQRVNTILPA